MVNLEPFLKHCAFKERYEASFIPHYSALLSLFISLYHCVCVYFLERDESESPREDNWVLCFHFAFITVCQIVF